MNRSHVAEVLAELMGGERRRGRSGLFVDATSKGPATTGQFVCYLNPTYRVLPTRCLELLDPCPSAVYTYRQR